MSTLKNKRPVIVGLFILAGFAILIVTIFTIGGQKNSFAQSYTIRAVFLNAGGLIKGANVWLYGVKVGTVKSIGFYGTGQVEVIMSVENEAQPHIRKNTIAKVGSDGLIGNKIVIIYGGDPSSPQAETNDVLHTEAILSTDDMLATLQQNNKNLLEITKDFKSIGKKLDSGTGILPTLLNDTRIAQKFTSSVNNLETTLSNFKTVSVNSKEILSNFKNLSANINKPGNSINELATDTLLYRQIRGSLTQLENAAAAVSKFSTNLRIASERLSQKENIAGVVLNDTLAASSVKTTLHNLETSSQKLDEDLEALQHNFFLRGFFRKKEKATEKEKAKVQ